MMGKSCTGSRILLPYKLFRCSNTQRMLQCGCTTLTDDLCSFGCGRSLHSASLSRCSSPWAACPTPAGRCVTSSPVRCAWPAGADHPARWGGQAGAGHRGARPRGRQHYHRHQRRGGIPVGGGPQLLPAQRFHPAGSGAHAPPSTARANLPGRESGNALFRMPALPTTAGRCGRQRRATSPLPAAGGAGAWCATRSGTACSAAPRLRTHWRGTCRAAADPCRWMRAWPMSWCWETPRRRVLCTGRRSCGRRPRASHAARTAGMHVACLPGSCELPSRPHAQHAQRDWLPGLVKPPRCAPVCRPRRPHF